MFEVDDFCQTCLCRDRKLYPIQELSSLMHEIKLHEFIHKNGAVCWECKSLITKYYNFRLQVLKARDILANRVEIKDIKCLSKLTISSCENIDLYDVEPFVEVTLPIEYEPVIKEEKVECDNELKQEPLESESDVDVIQCDEHKNNKADITTKAVDDFEDSGDRNVETGSRKVIQNIENEIVKIVLNEDEMLKHRELLRNDPVYKVALFKCDRCIKGYNKKDDYKNHLIYNHQETAAIENKCDICGLTFQAPEHARDHRKMHYTLYKCTLCDFVHNVMWSAMLHYKKKHMRRGFTARRRRPKNLNEYACVCGSKFATNTMLYKHERACKKVEKKQECEHCGRKFRFAYQLTKHELVHAGMPMFKCEVCQKEYRGAWGLKIHMKTHSNSMDEKAYCTECNRHFKNRKIYKTHLKTNLRHAKDKDMKYPCPHCDLRFPFRSYLRRHIMIHGETRDYGCLQCAQTFKTPVALRRHIRDKHELVEQPRNYICDICGRAFKHKPTLGQHINSHTGARPYECGDCGATFSYSGALYTHVKLKHKMIKRAKTKTSSKD